MTAEFTTDEVKGKGRPRFWQGHAVTPPETRAYEFKLKNAYIKQCQSYMFGGAVKVEIEAVFPITKSTNKKNRALMLIGNILPTKKPDSDNIAKAVLDALQGTAFVDDSCVTELVVTKRYGEEEAVNIKISDVEQKMSETELIDYIFARSNSRGDKLLDFLDRFRLDALKDATAEQLAEYAKTLREDKNGAEHGNAFL